MTVRCGNHRAEYPHEFIYHETALAVRDCYDPSVETFLCTWLYKAGYDEDGGEIIRECRALAHVTPRGWECEHGHDYVSMEARYNEGWDYASDEQEAALLRKHGVDAVAMNGGSI